MTKYAARTAAGLHAFALVAGLVAAPQAPAQEARTTPLEVASPTVGIDASPAPASHASEAEPAPGPNDAADPRADRTARLILTVEPIRMEPMTFEAIAIKPMMIEPRIVTMPRLRAANPFPRDLMPMEPISLTIPTLERIDLKPFEPPVPMSFCGSGHPSPDPSTLTAGPLAGAGYQSIPTGP